MTLAAIVMFICSGVLAYISYLRSQLEKHQTQNAILQSQVQENEFKQQLDAAKVKVDESVKDYSQSSTDFRAKYPDDGSGSPK